jgi:hypothetical protein
MPSTFTSLTTPNAFGEGFFIDWFERPPAFPDEPMRPGTPFTDGNNIYDYGDLTLTIDVAGPQVELSECSPNGRVRGQFRRGDPVLLGDNQASTRPIRILFARPVRAVGAFIGAEGLAGAAYRASLTVPDAAGGPDCGVRANATLSLAANSAPFLGLQCDQGELIREVWFKASSADGNGGIPRVAISQLYYLPADA